MMVELFIKRCFAVALADSLELQVKPEDVIVVPKGSNGEYDCRVDDTEHKIASIATGSFYGYASRGAVCIAKIYDPKNGRWNFPNVWREYSTQMLSQPTGWPAVAE